MHSLPSVIAPVATVKTTAALAAPDVPAKDVVNVAVPQVVVVVPGMVVEGAQADEREGEAPLAGLEGGHQPLAPVEYGNVNSGSVTLTLSPGPSAALHVKVVDTVDGMPVIGVPIAKLRPVREVAFPTTVPTTDVVVAVVTNVL